MGKIITDLPKAGIRQLCRWTWKATRGERGRVLLACVLGVLRVAASLGFIWVSKLLIDSATAAGTSDGRLWQLAIVLSVLMLAEMALAQGRAVINSLSSQRMTNTLRRRIYSHLLAGDIYAEGLHSGNLLERITGDVSTVVSTVVRTLPDIFLMAVQLVAAFWLLVVMNPMIALCALLITPVTLLASRLYMMKMRRVNAAIRNGESLLHVNMQEGLQHRVVVQTLECAPEITARFVRLQGDVYGNVLSRTRINLFSAVMVRLGFISGYLIAFVWSVFGLHSGVITYGIMAAFLQLVGRIQGPLSGLSATLPSLISTSTAVDRLMEIYHIDDESGIHAPATSPAAIKERPVGVRLKGVTFAYPGSDERVFEAFSHDFIPGSKTVVMGRTGVGKSTLTKLILALLRPQEGEIEVYSPHSAEAASAATRRFMTYVPQGNSLLHGTIRENLLLANPQASEEQMRRALHTAVADFVFDLPEGLDTPCGELGGGLSEGQCQRIAIARALLRECPVLILDEFNSSLDQSTAETLLERLLGERAAATIIFISHRPEVARHCDEVLTLTR